MKQNLCLTLCVLFFIFLIFSSRSSAIRREKENPQLNTLVSAIPMEDEFDDKLMGMDYCQGEEECLRGRMMREAHLDYIYTQHHKH
ncbi:unnamed protein product [Cochlearia groenlandica]